MTHSVVISHELRSTQYNVTVRAEGLTGKFSYTVRDESGRQIDVKTQFVGFEEAANAAAAAVKHCIIDSASKAEAEIRNLLSERYTQSG